MALRSWGRKADDGADLRTWLVELQGGPVVTDTVMLTCGRHGDERPTWHYVQADPAAGVALRRCVSCGFAVSVLDSDLRWTYPATWSCGGCGHSLAEVAAGLSAPDGAHVQWVVLAARCVECRDVEGLTDLVVDGRPLSEVVVGL